MEIKTKIGKRVVEDSSGNTVYFVGERIFPDQDALSFLDRSAFDSGEGVCYIPDIAFVEHKDKHSKDPGFAPDMIPAAEAKAKYIYDRPKLVAAFGGNTQLVESLFDSLIYARPEAYKKAYDALFGKVDGK